ncbi:MAG TPA: TIGR03790 family protein [Prosthecobacter sp.]|nr:TIGR03790 family protein [Prosthecobacter sp.]HRK12999.1 TIGR03790 family protein [Prosthecobacter sp.]
MSHAHDPAHPRRPVRRRGVAGFWLAAWLLAVEGLRGQEAGGFDLSTETVVAFNPDYAQSRELAQYYARMRGIPQERLVALECPLEDSMSRDEFERRVRRPLFETFVRKGWWELGQVTLTDPATGRDAPAMAVTRSSARVLVLMRGIPFQIRREKQNPQNSQEDEAGVDSELCVLGLPRQPAAGAVPNPYFNQSARFQLFQTAPGLLLVARLDGPDADTVKRMVDDSLAAEREGLRGRAVIDLAQKSGAYQEGEDWLKRSAILLRGQGIPVFLDRGESLIPDHWPLPDTALYFGWYAAHASGAVASPSFRFTPGAVACHLHSFSGAALRSPDRHWAGPLLRQGAAAVMGNVFEPYLSLTVHFDILNQRLLEGFTLGEAAWNATPVLSWMNVLCGDPLYRPFAKGPGSAMGEGRERDYALYQGAALRHPGEDTRALKSELAALAGSRSKPHLLELTALLSASEGKPAEAADLLDHARSLYVLVPDRARALLYQARCMLDDDRPDEAARLLRLVTGNPAHKDQPALLAARALLEQIPAE